jgi:hypothetical protein
LNLVSITSIDMVRISFKVHNPDFFMKNIQDFWDKNITDMGIKHWESTKYSDFHHTWTIPLGGSVLTLLYDHNTTSGNQRGRKGCFEWNPNKVDIFLNKDVFYLVRSVLCSGLFFELTRADIAHDFENISIHQCVIDKRLKQSVRYFMGVSNSMTVYAGSYGSGGSVKLYDKGREVLETTGKDIGHLIRYEISYKSNITFFNQYKIGAEIMGNIERTVPPDLIIMGVSDDLFVDIPVEQLLIAEGLCNKPHLFTLLSKYKKKQIKEMKCCSTFSPSVDQDELILKTWFKKFYELIVT